MEKRFFIDRSVIRGLFYVLAAFPILMSFLASLVGRFFITLPLTLASLAFLTLLWVAFTRGTYVAIRGDKLINRALFLPPHITNIHSITAVYARPIFAGGMSQIFIKTRLANGKSQDRSIANVPSLRRRDLAELLGLISAVNPEIKIQPALLAIQ